MKSITAIKEVKKSGSSKAIYVTNELSLLGIENEGEKVEITITKID